MNHKELGNWGEGVAALYLRDHGYKIIQQNYRLRLGEIDLIVEDITGRICFIEVKTRLSIQRGLPIESVTPKKQHQLRIMAMCYLKSTYKRVDIRCRFDIISIIKHDEGSHDIQHLANAF